MQSPKIAPRSEVQAAKSAEESYYYIIFNIDLFNCSQYTYTFKVIDNVNPFLVDADYYRNVFVTDQADQTADWLLDLAVEKSRPEYNHKENHFSR